jgi:hypothetical protein
MIQMIHVTDSHDSSERFTWFRWFTRQIHMIHVADSHDLRDRFTWFTWEIHMIHVTDSHDSRDGFTWFTWRIRTIHVSDSRDSHEIHTTDSRGSCDGFARFMWRDSHMFISQLLGNTSAVLSQWCLGCGRAENALRDRRNSQRKTLQAVKESFANPEVKNYYNSEIQHYDTRHVYVNKTCHSHYGDPGGAGCTTGQKRTKKSKCGLGLVEENIFA